VEGRGGVDYGVSVVGVVGGDNMVNWYAVIYGVFIFVLGLNLGLMLSLVSGFINEYMDLLVVLLLGVFAGYGGFSVGFGIFANHEGEK